MIVIYFGIIIFLKITIIVYTTIIEICMINFIYYIKFIDRHINEFNVINKIDHRMIIVKKGVFNINEATYSSVVRTRSRTCLSCVASKLCYKSPQFRKLCKSMVLFSLYAHERDQEILLQLKSRIIQAA